MGKKAIIPSNKELLKIKTLYTQKKEPIWVALEKEMRANAEKKPYDEKTGKWLVFLKDLIYHYYTTEKRNYKKLKKEIGPPWYFELSEFQKSILRKLRNNIHQDILENRPYRTKQCIRELGITLKFSNDMLMQSMLQSVDDPGVFLWKIYNMYYKVPPSELQKYYDVNAMLLMSALVFVDIDDCKSELIRATEKKPLPPPKPPKPHKKYFQPKVKYGEYLQQIYVPCYSNYPATTKKKRKPIMPLKTKIKLRSEKSYMELAKNDVFLEMRRERNRQEKPKERICNYKFWTPPGTLRNMDPKTAAYVLKLKMFTERSRPRHMKHKLPFENIQYCVKNVSYANGHPVYILECVCSLATGYIPINGGGVLRDKEKVTNILGFARYPLDDRMACKSSCDCLSQWEKKVTEYFKLSKCDCQHNYDFGHEGKPRRKYFYPPKNTDPLWIDNAEVYKFDVWDDFIQDELKSALDSHLDTATTSSMTVSPSKLKKKDLLAAFLGDLSMTPLLIPHLPQANLLKNLQELVRKRVKGESNKKTHTKLMLKTKRKWLNLDHLDFKTRAYMIPFTRNQLENLNFSHRPQIQKLFLKLLRDYEKRTRESWLAHTRMFWSTMKHEKYPNKSFLDAFFTYMPSREMDTFIVNPFSPDITPKFGAKTCPLPRTVALK